MQNEIEKYNYSICVFQTGKQYHCDLNASYNIGACYFVRELLKSDSVRKRLPNQTKDSDYDTGTTRTLSSLIKLNTDISKVSLLTVWVWLVRKTDSWPSKGAEARGFSRESVHEYQDSNTLQEKLLFSIANYELK